MHSYAQNCKSPALMLVQGFCLIKRCAPLGAYQNGLPSKPGRTPLLRATTLVDAAALRELQALCNAGDYSARLGGLESVVLFLCDFG
jgi:hypothetical protein